MLWLLALLVVLALILYAGWRGYFGKTVQTDEAQALQAAKDRLSQGSGSASSDQAKKG